MKCLTKGQIKFLIIRRKFKLGKLAISTLSKCEAYDEVGRMRHINLRDLGGFYVVSEDKSYYEIVFADDYYDKEIYNLSEYPQKFKVHIYELRKRPIESVIILTLLCFIPFFIYNLFTKKGENYA